MIRVYPESILYEEVAFLAYYLHWSHKEIMCLPHKERVRFCREVSQINKRMNEEATGKKNIFDV